MPLKSYISQFIDSYLSVLPSILPVVLLIALAEFQRRKKNRSKWKIYLIASTISAVLPALAVLDITFGSSGDGQAGLAFLFLPAYSILFGGLSVIVGLVILKRKNQFSITTEERPKFFWHIIPGALILCFLVSSSIFVHQNVILNIAENSDSLEELNYLYSRAKKNDDHGIFLFLAQNPNAPTEILDKMSELPYSSVRIFVAKHDNTSLSVLERLAAEDENEYVKDAARETLLLKTKK
jgi:hypothetical protein